MLFLLAELQVRKEVALPGSVILVAVLGLAGDIGLAAGAAQSGVGLLTPAELRRRPLAAGLTLAALTSVVGGAGEAVSAFGLAGAQPPATREVWVAALTCVEQVLLGVGFLAAAWAILAADRFVRDRRLRVALGVYVIGTLIGLIAVVLSATGRQSIDFGTAANVVAELLDLSGVAAVGSAFWFPPAGPGGRDRRLGAGLAVFALGRAAVAAAQINAATEGHPLGKVQASRWLVASDGVLQTILFVVAALVLVRAAARGVS